MKKYQKNNYTNGKSRRAAERLRRIHAQNIAWLNETKRQRGCEVTGRRLPPDQLDFHHPSGVPADLKVSKAKWRSRTALKELVARCQLIGRDVHRWHHQRS